MPFIDMNTIEAETVTPKHSTAFGELVTGEQIEVGRLFYEKDTGAEEHAHPHEQAMYIIEGRLQITLDGETAVMEPGGGFHAPPNVPHSVTALEDTVVISVKGVVGGVGHRI